MTSNINPAVPSGTQAFGAELRANLAAAKAEIEALQPGSSTVGNYKGWQTEEAVSEGDRRTSDTPRRIYVAASSGTTGDTPPTGTGTAISDGEGGVEWDFLRADIFVLDNDEPAGAAVPGTAALIDLSNPDIFWLKVIATENTAISGYTRLKLPPAPDPAGRRLVFVERAAACTAVVELYGFDANGQGFVQMTQPDRWISAIWSTAEAKWERGPAGFKTAEGYRGYLGGTGVGHLVRLVDVGGGLAGFASGIDGSGLINVQGGGGGPGSYQPLVHTPVALTAELLDGGDSGSDPMGTWRVYSGDDVIVTVIDTIPSNAQWLAVRDGSALTFRSVAEWDEGQIVAIGDRRWVDDSGTDRVYVATSAGTTGATPPSGTGTGIDDGGVDWDYDQDGGPVTFNGQPTHALRGAGSAGVFQREGSTGEINVIGSAGAPVVFPPETVAEAARSGSDLVLDLDAASVFDYETDATAFTAIDLQNVPENGAVSVLLRLTRAGAGGAGFGGVDFGDDGAPILGATAGDKLYVTFTWDGSAWAGIKTWSKTA